MQNLNKELISRIIRNCHGFVDQEGNLYYPYVDEDEDSDSFMMTYAPSGRVCNNYLYKGTLEGSSVTFKSTDGSLDEYHILVLADPEKILSLD